MHKLLRLPVILFLLFLLPGCMLSPDAAVSIKNTLPVHTTTPAQTRTAPPLASLTPSASASPAYTPTPALQVCSPLDEVAIADLTKAITNPYHPPPPGSDNPHEGIDLAVLLPDSGIAIKGAPVHAVLPGRVAAIIDNRFPYGNAIIVETPIQDLPAEWVASLNLPPAIPTLPPNPALTCPAVETNITWDEETQSIYLVYAHLNSPVKFTQGEYIPCGQILGAIGDSGNALNPHLHLEARIGPTGARFPSMSHYDSSATPQEMATYCLWRVSGWFQLFDPINLFTMGP